VDGRSGSDGWAGHPSLRAQVCQSKITRYRGDKFPSPDYLVIFLFLLDMFLSFKFSIYSHIRVTCGCLSPLSLLFCGAVCWAWTDN
jgi:hypothetical protein